MSREFLFIQGNQFCRRPCGAGEAVSIRYPGGFSPPDAPRVLLPRGKSTQKRAQTYGLRIPPFITGEFIFCARASVLFCLNRTAFRLSGEASVSAWRLAVPTLFALDTPGGCGMGACPLMSLGGLLNGYFIIFLHDCANSARVEQGAIWQRLAIV